MNTTHLLNQSPKFTDSFERELANDTAFHLGRAEPSALLPLLKRLAKTPALAARALRSLRTTAAQQPRPSILGS